MNVGMEYRVASILADIYADIEPGHLIINPPYLALHIMKKCMSGVKLRLIKRKKVGYMPFRDYQHMVKGHRKGVADGERKPIFCHDSTNLRLTERAI